MAGPIIDSHAHVIADSAAYPYAPRGGTLPAWLPERLQTAERLMASMDAAGVQKAVLVQYASVHGYDCSYVIDTARQHPGRFVAVCAIDPMSDSAPDDQTKWMEQGAAGFRIAAPARDAEPGWVMNDLVWRRTAELDRPLCVHFMAGVSAAGLPMLRTMMERYEEVPVVLDHAGNPPWTDHASDYGLKQLLELSHLNLTIKFSTINLERLDHAGVEPGPALKALVESFGAERLMWGSDAPNTPGLYEDMLSKMTQAASVLTHDDREWLFGLTAQRIYPGLEEKASSLAGGK